MSQGYTRIGRKDVETLHYRKQVESCASLPLQKTDQGLLTRVSCFRRESGLNLAAGAKVEGQNTRERKVQHS